MRRWSNKQGNYIGYHYIFDTEFDAAHYLGLSTVVTHDAVFELKDNFWLESCKRADITDTLQETFPHWSDIKAVPLSWVRSDDGRVIQLLNRYIMPRSATSKVQRKKTLQEHPEPIPGDTEYIKFPFVSTCIYYKKDGTKRYPYMHTDVFVKHGTNRSSGTLSGKQNNPVISKRLFAYYLVITGNPVSAYQLTFPGAYKNKLLYRKLKSKALTWMKDELVLKEIMGYMDKTEYRENFLDQAKKLGVDDKLFLTELKRGVEEAKPGTEDHQNMLKMLIEVVEKSNDVKLITEKGDDGVEATHIAPTSNINLIPTPHEEIKDKVVAVNPELKLPTHKENLL